MEQPLTHSMRRASLFMRTIAATVVVTFSMLVLTPAAAAVRTEAKHHTVNTRRTPGAERQLDQRVQQVQTRLTELKTKLAAGKSATTEREDIKKLHKEIEALDRKVTANFKTLDARLRTKKVPEVILQRQRAMETKYRSKMDALLGTLRTVDSDKDDTTRLHAAEQELTRLKGMRHHPARRRFDPNDLPNQIRRPNKHNRPKTRKRQFITAGLTNNPLPMYASLGNYDYSSLAGASDPAYLAADSEVTLSSAIKAQAAALGNDPVKIYNWVHNNVRWIPSWGAMQDADTTLGSLRGNAFDISALTIALLRASGIPARFVHGTIDVPAKQFMNWAGGFSSITAAANYASSGGIPITPLIEGGQITMVRMEHIWVEAAIDYYPSRGAVMHSADTWVAIDPSYKQYQYKQGVDFTSISGIDAKTTATNYIQSGTVNDTEGWIQGLDPTVIQNTQNTILKNMQDYVANNMSNPTMNDITGGRTIVQKNLPTLPSSLPNHIVVIGARYGTLPNSLRETMTFSLGTDILGNMTNPITLPWSELNNHKVTLSFRPATTDDKVALENLLPSGEITDLSQIPSSIPAYLINVVPELKIDGKVVLTGSPLNLGDDQTFAFKFGGPSESDTKIYMKPVIAGSYLAVTTVGGSISSQKLDVLRSKLAATQASLQSGDPTQINTLSREDIFGDMFYAGTLAYYAELKGMGDMLGLTEKSNLQLLPSGGTYGYVPSVNYLFGIPESISSGGIQMDLDRVMTACATNSNKNDALKSFNLQIGGIGSALEAAIPEQMFITPSNHGQAISAVRAIQIAEQQGQHIYVITQANMNTALPNLHLNSLAMTEIEDALNAGNEVITHTDPISVSGWSGAGYIIINPSNGDGAWKIAGGLNGGVLETLSYVFKGLSALYTIVKPLGTELSDVMAKALDLIGAVFSLVSAIQDIANHCFKDGLIIYASMVCLAIFTAAVAVALPELLIMASMTMLDLVGAVAVMTSIDIGLEKIREVLQEILCYYRARWRGQTSYV